MRSHFSYIRILPSSYRHPSTLPAHRYPAHTNVHSDLKKDQHQDSSMMCLSLLQADFTQLTMPCPPSNQGLINLEFKHIISQRICCWKAFPMWAWRRSWQPWLFSMVTTWILHNWKCNCHFCKASFQQAVTWKMSSCIYEAILQLSKCCCLRSSSLFDLS